MINIITTSLESRNRGPKKVVLNMIKGLEKIGYPYVINRRLDATQRLWIHDDISALFKIKDLPQEIKIIIGPNLFINPEDIPVKLDISRSLYIHPSQNVIDIWKKKGYERSAISTYPSGIDTEAFAPSGTGKNKIILYFKNRSEKELLKVREILNGKDIHYVLFRYGSYQENDYKKALAEAHYIIWLGGYESQGIALEEALSCNVPILIIEKDPGNEYEQEATAAPYWSEECGIKTNISDFVASLSKMEQETTTFTPRLFIEKELNLEKQARSFIQMYQDHFGLSFEDGFKARLLRDGIWKGGRLKKFIKRLIMW